MVWHWYWKAQLELQHDKIARVETTVLEVAIAKTAFVDLMAVFEWYRDE